MKNYRLRLAFSAPALLALLMSCAASDQLTSSGSPASLASGYKLAKWAANVSIIYPNDCTMTVVTDGLPNHAVNSFYLEPLGRGASVSNAVAYLPTNNTALALVPYRAIAKTTMFSVNICPSKAAAPTPSNQGPIGFMISGPALFNATEGDGRTPALQDNVSHSFVDTNGTRRTASFIDQRLGHATPVGGPQGGGTYHYHGLPPCVTAQVDQLGGPSHIIGVAADGFPIYGDKDINGKTVTLAQLDECNGITSPTPEFPNGVYHYVLPAGEKGLRSSLRCFAGKVTPRRRAELSSLAVCEASAVDVIKPITQAINRSDTVNARFN
jgi:hypothetical protein